MEENKDKQKKDKQKEVIEVSIGMAQSEQIQTQGEAASQILQVKRGIRVNSKGQQVEFKGRSLDQIHNYSTGEGDYSLKEQMRKRQAGHTAELIKEARDNKRAVQTGDQVRTSTTDGIGRTNDRQYDHLKLDKKGDIVPGSESQMKFYGIDSKGHYKVIDKMVKDVSWDRYSDKPLDIPKEQYDGAVKYAEDQAQKYRAKADRYTGAGDKVKAEKAKTTAERYERAAKQVRKADVTTNEAIFAAKHPDLFTAKEVIGDANKSGLEGAAGAVLLSSSISAAQNLYAVISGDKDFDEAVEDVIDTAVSSGGMAYVVNGGGTVIKAMMHASRSEIVRDAGTTNLPASIAVATVETAKSLKKYINGEIDEEELLIELGEKGTGMVASGMGTASGMATGAMIGSMIPGIGTAVGGVIGGFIGGMIAYSSSDIIYRGAYEALEEERASEERRVIVEQMAAEAIYENRRYQGLIEHVARSKYNIREKKLDEIFQQIDKSLMNNDIGMYMESLQGIGDIFGICFKFESFADFDDFMKDENTILSFD